MFNEQELAFIYKVLDNITLPGSDAKIMAGLILRKIEDDLKRSTSADKEKEEEDGVAGTA